MGHPFQRLVDIAATWRLNSTEESRRKAFDEVLAISNRSRAVFTTMWLGMLAHWHHAGANVLDMTDSLTAALLLTQIPGHGWPADLRLPFDSFLAQIPPGFIQHHPDRWVRYLLVEQVRNGDQGFVIAFATDGLTLDPDEESADQVLFIPLGTYAAPPPFNDLSEQMLGVAHSAKSNKRLRGVVAVIRRLLAGLCSWIHSMPGAPGAERSGLSAQRRSRPVESPRVIVVGREVKLSREMRDAAKDLSAAAQGVPRAHWKLRFKHVVRGHWRNQAVGPSHGGHRLTWVRPYWKGPEGAGAWSHLYGPQAGGERRV